MKLYLILQKVYATGYLDSSIECENLRGIYKKKENAEKVLKKKFAEEGYIHKAKMVTIDTDLFEDNEL